jgi:hypothetical protein
MIQWLNKQLNEKQASAASGLYGTSKPPMMAGVTSAASQFGASTFKPTSAAAGALARSSSNSNFGTSNISKTSMQSPIRTGVATGMNFSAKVDNPLKTNNFELASEKSIGQHSLGIPASTENVKTSIGFQPVSKYTR